MSYATSQNGTTLKMLECRTADCPEDGPSLDVIRQIIEEEKAATPVAPQHLLPELASPDEMADTKSRKPRRRLRLPNPFAPLGRRVVAKAKGFQPSWRLSGLLLLASVVIAWPWLIPGGVAVVAFTLVIAWLTLGPDRASELAAGGFARFAKRFPNQADKLTRLGGRVSARFAAIAGWLPARWTEDLHLSDLAAAQEPNANMATDPFDRLARDAHGA